jgi:hypothetical protein
MNPISGYSVRSERHNMHISVFETHLFFWSACNLPTEKPSNPSNVFSLRSVLSARSGRHSTVLLIRWGTFPLPCYAASKRHGTPLRGPARLSPVSLGVVLTGGCQRNEECHMARYLEICIKGVLSILSNIKIHPSFSLQVSTILFVSLK